MYALVPAFVVLIGPALAGDPVAEPFSSCRVERWTEAALTGVALSCPEVRVGVRKFRPGITTAMVTDQAARDLEYTAEALGLHLTRTERTLSVGGRDREVTQNVLDGGPDAPSSTNYEVVYAARDGVRLIECSPGTAGTLAACERALDRVLEFGVPVGAELLPFVDELKRGKVLGVEVKVTLGCKAQQYLEDARIQIACADGMLYWGVLDEDPLAAPEAQPDEALQGELRAGGGAVESTGSCQVAGVKSTCWTGTTSTGIRTRAHTARFAIHGTSSVFGCMYTAVGDVVHPLCAQLLTLP